MLYHSFSEHIGLFEGPGFSDKLLSSCYKLQELDPDSDGSSNQGGWQKNCLEVEDFKPLKYLLLLKFAEYIKVYNLQTPIYAAVTKLFININPPGAGNYMHHHSGDQWSGVFWLSGDSYESGDLWIMNPMRNSCLSTHFHGCAEHNAINIPPRSDKGVFFGSHLIHYVDINRSDSDRVSIGYHIDTSKHPNNYNFRIDP